MGCGASKQAAAVSAPSAAGPQAADRPSDSAVEPAIGPPAPPPADKPSAGKPAANEPAAEEQERAPEEPAAEEQEPAAGKVPSTYLPRHLCRPSLKPPTGPSATRFTAAVLLVDISGFTRLSESFAQAGPEGCESFSLAINAYFGRILKLVLGQGDVQSFNGDAILATFESPEAALRCGWALLHGNGLSPYQPEGSSTELTLHIGLAIGPLAAVSVGGHSGLYQALVVGDCVYEIDAALSQAKASELVVSASAREHFGGASGVELSADGYTDGCARVDAVAMEGADVGGAPEPAPTPDDAVLEAYMVPVVLARERARQGAWIAEQREVAIVFVAILPGGNSARFAFGDDGMPGPLLESLQAAAVGMQEAVYNRDGFIRQMTMDDKGLVCLASFGLPRHEDDARRAVAAGLAMQHACADAGLRAHVGVTQGRVYCGLVGERSLRCELALVGDIVNMSARLCAQAAKRGLVDAVVCSSGVHDELEGDRFSMEPLGSVRVKGKDAEVSIFAAREGARKMRRQRTAAVMVGRAAEEDRARTVVESFLRGDDGPAVMVVRGGAGTGKTTLVNIAVGAWLKCAAWRAEAQPEDRLSAFGAVRAVVAAAVASHDAPLNKVVTDAVGAEGAVFLEASLDTKFGSDLVSADQRSRLERMPPSLLSDRIRSMTMALLQRLVQAEEGRVAVVLEDLHWVDDESAKLLAAVAAAPWAKGKLLLLVSTRPDAEGGSALVDSESAEVLDLSDLGRDSVASLVAQELVVGAVDRSLLDVLDERAGGNPLFVQASVQQAQAQEQLEITARAEVEQPVRERLLDIVTDIDLCAILRAAELDIPNTLSGLLQARIDQLPPSTALLCKVASVLGPQFAISELQAIFPIADERASVPEQVAAAIEDGGVLAASSRPGTHAQFRHALLADAAHQLLLIRDRRSLHRAAAIYLEEQHAPDGIDGAPRTVLVRIARHWTRALALDGTDDEDDMLRAVSALEAACVAASQDTVPAVLMGTLIQPALAVIGFLPDSTRVQTLEVGLQLSLAMCSLRQDGPGEAYLAAMRRAVDLQERLKLPQTSLRSVRFFASYVLMLKNMSTHVEAIGAVDRLIGSMPPGRDELVRLLYGVRVITCFYAGPSHALLETARRASGDGEYEREIEDGGVVELLEIPDEPLLMDALTVNFLAHAMAQVSLLFTGDAERFQQIAPNFDPEDPRGLAARAPMTDPTRPLVLDYCMLATFAVGNLEDAKRWFGVYERVLTGAAAPIAQHMRRLPVYKAAFEAIEEGPGDAGRAIVDKMLEDGLRRSKYAPYYLYTCKAAEAVEAWDLLDEVLDMWDEQSRKDNEHFAASELHRYRAIRGGGADAVAESLKWADKNGDIVLALRTHVTAADLGVGSIDDLRAALDSVLDTAGRSADFFAVVGRARELCK